MDDKTRAPLGDKEAVEQWSMKNFYIDGNGEVKHNRLTLIMDAFIANARNPHKGKPTHG